MVLESSVLMCTNLFKNILIGTHSSMYVVVAAPLYPQEEFYFTTVLVKKKVISQRPKLKS